MSETATLVDARGLLCPWPVMRLLRAVRQSSGSGLFCVIADDPIAPAELTQLCAERGWSIARDGEDPHRFHVVTT